MLVDWDVPQRMTEEEVRNIAPIYIKTKCPVLKQRIINGHMRLALKLASRFVSSKSDKDDIVASALLGLTQAVEWLPTRMVDDDVSPYISSTITSHIRNFLRHDTLVPIPQHQFKDYYEKGCVPYFSQIPASDKDEENYEQEYLQDNVPAVFDDAYCEMQDFIDFVSHDGKYRDILNLLVQGYTLTEIADKLETTKQNISFIIMKIRRKVKYYDKERFNAES